MSDFSKRINEILNHGALNLAMAIGYKNQIFDILEDLNKPVTVLEIASASGLHERYLKEWLGIMVTGKIIELSRGPDGEDTYFLPPEHASFLTRKAGSNQADNIDHPMGPFLYAVSLMHCMPVGLNDNGTGLGMMWGQEKAEALLRDAGFEHIEIMEMEHDPFNLHYLCK